MSQRGFVKVLEPGSLAPGQGKVVDVAGRNVAIYNRNGRHYAIDDSCPHMGGSIGDGPLDGDLATCPWHGWQFDVCTGKTPMGSRVKQAVFAVKVEGQDVLVDIV